jgi:glucose-6-phosphate isomerase
MQALFPQFTQFDPITGTIEGVPGLERRLSDLRGYFADQAAYQSALAQEDALLYTVTNIEPAQGDGALHYGISYILPGRVGREYYMTKGHFHAYRPAAEYYFGLRGGGLLLFENEQGHCWSAPIMPNSGVYVPGHTAHRTINTGLEPLVFLGIYPFNAGHDYGTIQARNFSQVVVEVNSQPTVMERATFLKTLTQI